MRTSTKRGVRFSPDEGSAWLRARMAELGIAGLAELEVRSGIDRGSISRYFRQERSASVSVIEPLCEALVVSPETLLVALGAIDRKSR